MIVTITVLLILIALVLFLIAPARPRPEQKKSFYKRNFAHRGLYAQDQSVPENSMEAFRAAVAADLHGADGRRALKLLRKIFQKLTV